MNDFNNNSDNQEFIKKLELLCDLETEKPVEEMDVSLVMACVELILELRGETVNFTPEEVEEKVRKIPFVEETTSLNTPPKSVKSRSTKVKSRKILLIAAIISILIAIFAVSSIAFNWNIFDELKNRFGTVAEVPVNEEVNISGVTVFSDGEFYFYNTLEDVGKNLNLNILYPTKLPSTVKLERIVLHEENFKKKVVFSFADDILTYAVTLDEKISEDIINVSTETIKVCERDCYMIEMSDLSQIQIYFEHNNNVYQLTYNSKQDLIKIVENLKELQ